MYLGNVKWGDRNDLWPSKLVYTSVFIPKQFSRAKSGEYGYLYHIHSLVNFARLLASKVYSGQGIQLLLTHKKKCGMKFYLNFKNRLLAKCVGSTIGLEMHSLSEMSPQFWGILVHESEDICPKWGKETNFFIRYLLSRRQKSERMVRNEKFELGRSADSSFHMQFIARVAVLKGLSEHDSLFWYSIKQFCLHSGCQSFDSSDWKISVSKWTVHVWLHFGGDILTNFRPYNLSIFVESRELRTVLLRQRLQTQHTVHSGCIIMSGKWKVQLIVTVRYWIAGIEIKCNSLQTKNNEHYFWFLDKSYPIYRAFMGKGKFTVYQEKR